MGGFFLPFQSGEGDPPMETLVAKSSCMGIYCIILNAVSTGGIDNFELAFVRYRKLLTDVFIIRNITARGLSVHPNIPCLV